MFDKAIEFISENWLVFVGGGIGVWVVGYWIYCISGRNKSWHKY